MVFFILFIAVFVVASGSYHMGYEKGSKDTIDKMIKVKIK